MLGNCQKVSADEMLAKFRHLHLTPSNSLQAPLEYTRAKQSQQAIIHALSKICDITEW